MNCTKNKALTEEQRDYIIYHRLDEYTNEMAVKLGVSEAQIISFLHYHGLPRKTKRVFNKTLDRIFSEAKAEKRILIIDAAPPPPPIINRAAFTHYDNPQFDDNYIDNAINGIFHAYKPQTLSAFSQEK